jgi:5-formyltetrahydrofolate cyclo-ligase
MAQRPIRHRALKAGKRIYLATLKLSGKRPFLLLDPRKLDPRDLWKASSIQGAVELGRPVTLRQMQALDLVIIGCVGVTPNGSRLGQGGGYADLEYALLREAAKLSARTPIVTTVHPSQVLADGEVPMLPHDISLDGYADPEGWFLCPRKHRRPGGIFWEELGEERRRRIPVLTRGALTRGRR